MNRPELVSEQVMEYLLAELSNYSAKSCAPNASNKTTSGDEQQPTSSASANEERLTLAAEMAAAKLERMGWSVGYRWTERLSENKTWNAAVATHATEILKKKFPIDTIKTAPILRSIEWPGRWQVLKLDDKTLILDAAHNPEGFEMLTHNLEDLVQKIHVKPVFIVGTTGEERRARGLMPLVANYARKLYLVTPEQPNATPTDSLETYLPEESKPLVSKTSVDALFPDAGTCTAGEPGDTVVVTGSIYLIGEVLKQLKVG